MKLKNLKKGFSLVEVSIVILIIGVIIAGISKSSTIYNKYILRIAQNETRNSPVNSIDGLVIWYEATLDESFDDRSRQDYDSLSAAEKASWSYTGKVNKWYDISTIEGKKQNIEDYSIADYIPKYKSDCINGLPCAYFDGVDDALRLSDLPISGGDFTIFIVEKSEINSAAYNNPAPLISANDISGSYNFLTIANYNNSQIYLSSATGYSSAYQFSSAADNSAQVHTITTNFDNGGFNDTSSNYFSMLYQNGNDGNSIDPSLAYGIYDDGDKLSLNLTNNPMYLGYGQVLDSTGSSSLRSFHGGIGEVIILTKKSLLPIVKQFKTIWSKNGT